MTAAEPTTPNLITMPEASVRGAGPLDRLRTVARLREAELIAAGVILRAGRHRLVNADRLDALAALVARAATTTVAGT